MKKRLLTLLFALTTLCGFAQWNPVINEYHYRGGTVCFQGEFVNVPDGKYPPHILLLIENNFTRTEENALVTVNRDGTFASNVHIPHSGNVYLLAEGYENSLPNDLYFFVGDTITLKVDVAARKTDVAPGSIAYWVNRCGNAYQELYSNSPYGDLSIWHNVARKGSCDEVEKFCRNLGKVVENAIEDIEKGRFSLPADIHPIAADIIRTNAIFEGFYNMVSIRDFYKSRKYAPHYDEASGRTVRKAVEGFEPLDNKWFYKFLRRNQKTLLDNPLAALYTNAGSLINRVEFGFYYLDNSNITLPIKAGTPQDVENYAFCFVLPAEYDRDFIEAALPMRSDTLLAVSDAFSYEIEGCREETGLQCNDFMMQWSIMRHLFSFRIEENQGSPDFVADYIAGAMPFITSPVIAHHYTKAYREYVKNNEMVAAGESVIDDPVLQKIIAPYKGNILFLDFWNMGCGPCRAAMMGQRKFLEDMEGLPVKFLYITEEKYREASEEWLGSAFIKGEHIYISSEDWNYLQAKLRFIGIPFSCIIDIDGTLHRDKNHTMVLEYLP